MVVVVVGFLVLVVVAASVLWLPRSRRGALSQVSAFQAARDVTNRWSADPASTPEPLQDYLRDQRPKPLDPDDTES